MYLKSGTILEDHRCFTKGDTFEFSDVTLLVGDQGCGKSTLLNLLQQNKLELDLTDLGKAGVNSYFFDAEKMNPRITDPQMYTNFDGTNRGIGMGNAVASRFMSHGETLVAFTVEALQKAEDCVILLDEPESSLSIRNQFRLSEAIFDAVTRNCQLIVATHCLPLIQSAPFVLSLEHKKRLNSE